MQPTIARAPSSRNHAVSPVYSVADLLVAYLAQLDIDTVFGIPGGAIEPLYNALARHQKEGGNMQHFLARHEAGAAFMADGYARETGKIGVCIATSGPGATNMITAVATAYTNRVPMLVITAQPALPQHGRHALQDSGPTGVDIVGMFRYVTSYSALVTHYAHVEHMLMAALYEARAQSRPVHLSIPCDVLGSQAGTSEPTHNVASFLELSPVVDLRGIDAVASLLEPHGRAVILIGGGCANAIADIMQYVERTQSPFITTPDGVGLINPHHPLYHGVFGFGGHRSASAALADPAIAYIIAGGVSMGEWNTSGWHSSLMNKRLIHIDAFDSHLGRTPMACQHIRGDIGSAFRSLASLMPELPNKAGISGRKWSPLDMFDDPIAFQSDAMPLKPQRLMNKLGHCFPVDTAYLADAGNSVAWATHYLYPQPNLLHDARHQQRDGWLRVTPHYAPMGWAIAAAIGTAAGNPNAPVVCITGDGSMLMSGQELSVAVQEQLCVIYVVLNDRALGMVKHGQRLAGAASIAYQLPVTDFAAVARAQGGRGHTIKSVADLEALDIKAMCNHPGPTLLDVYIDPEETPPMESRLRILASKE
ncbi:acetolactate synthase 3 large subunit [Pseudoduganella ginsengisoli]|uniref:Thiamine pyrophosphate-binding protein n=1 Tax=Pseudoduganella ginsengisoli TaxID=1462440 RepID=A0A6L6Q9I0_9BURK|nr:thiamine pyrophosphate-binding protein [Pseudoduganella ginsengisoli]MTW05882.1 thiamine pyrophosphate-binding protein [Pseudoduganella ginsengisoli]